jgi:hypothetical protein
MVLRRVFRMFGGMNMVRMRQMSVMSGPVVVAGLMMLRGFRVVMSGHAVMVGCRFMMICCLL